MVKNPCCPESVKRNVKQVKIGENLVGIAHLDEIMDETSTLNLRDEDEISQTLLNRIKVFNYVPSSAAAEYKSALLKEYKRRCR